VDSIGFKLSWLKSDVKRMLVKANVPTPRYCVIKTDQKYDTNDLKYPLLVKAADDHGSLSVTRDSVVTNEKELIQQAHWIQKTIGGDSLVEEYIDGRELAVTVMGNGDDTLLLPVSETIFGKEFADRPKIVTYEGKWVRDSEDYAGADDVQCPALLSLAQQQVIDQTVLESCRALHVRDYARFDIRLKGNIPYIIDYNANPGVGFEAPSRIPAEIFGLTYPEFIAAIVAVALRRSGVV